MDVKFDVNLVRRSQNNVFNPIVIILVFACLFSLLWALQKITPTLNKWNLNTFTTTQYLIASSGYLLLFSGLCFIKEKNRGFILITASLAFSMFLYGKLCLLFYIAAYFFYLLIYLKIKTSLKIILFFSIYEALIFLTLDILIFKHNDLFWYAFIFANFFSLRFILYLYHNIIHNFKKEPFLDYLLYIFSPAYFIIFPHIVILPKYDYFINSLLGGKDFLKIAKSGLSSFVKGLIYLAIYSAIFFITKGYEPENLALAGPFNFVYALLIICGYGNILLGLMKGLGYDIKSPFRSPFLSRNIIDLFDRFLIYFREYVVTIFFIPAAILTKRLAQYWRTFISAIIAVTFGITLHSFLSLGLDFCSGYDSAITGINGVSLSYLRQSYFGAGFLAFHLAIINILKNAFILGIILGLQLIYNHWSQAIKLSYSTTNILPRKYLLIFRFFRFSEYIIMFVVFGFMNA